MDLHLTGNNASTKLFIIINTFIYLSYSVHDQPAPLHDSSSGKEGLSFTISFTVLVFKVWERFSNLYFSESFNIIWQCLVGLIPIPSC